MAKVPIPWTTGVIGSRKDRAALLKALREIQARCARVEPTNDAIQDIWRTANFAVHAADKRVKLG